MKPAPSRETLIKQIHVAKRQLGLGDAEYRALLTHAAGVQSCASMTPVQLGKVLQTMQSAGFKLVSKGAPDGKKSPRANVRLIFGLWTELGRKQLVENASRTALFAFVEKMTRPEGGEKGSGIGHPDWLSNQQANKVVEALKAINARGAKKEG